MNKLIWRKLGKDELVEIGDYCAHGNPNTIYNPIRMKVRKGVRLVYDGPTLFLVDSGMVGQRSRKISVPIYRPTALHNHTRIPKSASGTETEPQRKIDLNL